jgi:NTE family protein
MHTVAHSSVPQLALVLGSGGVKSIAGLGLAQALHAQGLHPELIVGSSAGAVFGALIARGDRTEDATQTATRLWSRDITGRHRKRGWAQLAAPHLAGFDEHFCLRDDSLINARLQQAFGEQRLEELATPLVVAATDARTGESVLIREGRIVDALRATVALPFLFAPWHVQGRLLMDGSVSDPLPLHAAAHAHTTVALGFECPMPRRVDSPSRLATRLLSALTNNVMHARIAAAHAAGENGRCHVLLPQPERRVGLFDTHEMPAMVALGYRHGVQAAAALLARRQAPARTALALVAEVAA